MIKINEKDYPTKVSEMTLQQWSDVSNAVRIYEKDALLQFEAVLKALGVPDKEIDNIPLSMMPELYKSLEDDGNGFELVETIDNYEFTTPEQMTVKEGKMIDRLAVEFGNPTIALVAFFYRNPNLTINEHLDKAHIKHKMSQFKDMPAERFVVAMGKIMEYLTNQAQALSGEGK